jgi:hypothetical protein
MRIMKTEKLRKNTNGEERERLIGENWIKASNLKIIRRIACLFVTTV